MEKTIKFFRKILKSTLTKKKRLSRGCSPHRVLELNKKNEGIRIKNIPNSFNRFNKNN